MRIENIILVRRILFLYVYFTMLRFIARLYVCTLRCKIQISFSVKILLAYQFLCSLVESSINVQDA